MRRIRKQTVRIEKDDQIALNFLRSAVADFTDKDDEYIFKAVVKVMALDISQQLKEKTNEYKAK